MGQWQRQSTSGSVATRMARVGLLILASTHVLTLILRVLSSKDKNLEGKFLNLGLMWYAVPGREIDESKSAIAM